MFCGTVNSYRNLVIVVVLKVHFEKKGSGNVGIEGGAERDSRRLSTECRAPPWAWGVRCSRLGSQRASNP